MVKSPDLGELTARRKDEVEGTSVHYTIRKESKSFGLRLQVSAETSETEALVQSAPDASSRGLYLSPTEAADTAT